VVLKSGEVTPRRPPERQQSRLRGRLFHSTTCIARLLPPIPILQQPGARASRRAPPASAGYRRASVPRPARRAISAMRAVFAPNSTSQSKCTHDCLYGQTQRALASARLPVPIARPKSLPQPNTKKTGTRHDVKTRNVVISLAHPAKMSIVPPRCSCTGVPSSTGCTVLNATNPYTL
jgi:hypothetical protein